MIELKKCRLAEIDFDDRSYPFSCGPVPERLRKSVAAAGILQPPWLVPGDRGLVIVSGRRRLAVIRELSRSTAAFSEISYLDVADRDPEELFLEVCWENAGIREFNPVESADLFLAAESRSLEGRERKRLFSALGIPDRPRFHQRCRAIAGFPALLREMIAAGRVDGETIELLAAWSTDDLVALVDLAIDFNLRRNKLREVAGRLDDLACRDRIPVSAVIAACRQAVADDPGGDQVSTLRRCLKERLYPHLTSAWKNFIARREGLSLPAAIRLEPPPDFEGGDYRLSFSFDGARQWREIVGKLNALTSEEIDELCRRP
ncbi:MAG: hypothetical protein GXO34_07480 [Deltaproteobacteria bacterium]|nr:hypothetical protein [Deltaproteobacteria bacterium]